MDPFSEDDNPPPDPTPATPRRPWWKWNFFVLAGALFAVLWVRELVDMPVGGAVVVALFVAATWVMGPAMATGAPLVNQPMRREPREATSGRPRRDRLPLEFAGRMCRVAAIVIGVLGVLQAITGSYWTFTQLGRIGPAGLQWTALLSLLYSVGHSLALAIGLWTIGAVAARVEELLASSSSDER